MAVVAAVLMRRKDCLLVAAVLMRRKDRLLVAAVEVD
jgi:hypothetical protein